MADAVVEIDAAMDMGDMARRRREMAGSPEAYAVYQRAYSQTVEGTQGSIQQARRHWNKLVTIGANPGLGLGLKVFLYCERPIENLKVSLCFGPLGKTVRLCCG